jgi:hypothetical protein
VQSPRTCSLPRRTRPRSSRERTPIARSGARRRTRRRSTSGASTQISAHITRRVPLACSPPIRRWQGVEHSAQRSLAPNYALLHGSAANVLCGTARSRDRRGQRERSGQRRESIWEPLSCRGCFLSRRCRGSPRRRHARVVLHVLANRRARIRDQTHACISPRPRRRCAMTAPPPRITSDSRFRAHRSCPR